MCFIDIASGTGSLRKQNEGGCDGGNGGFQSSTLTLSYVTIALDANLLKQVVTSNCRLKLRGRLLEQLEFGIMIVHWHGVKL